jgi:hypothetical protein
MRFMRLEGATDFSGRNAMKTMRYRLSFTSGGLLAREAAVGAAIYQRLGIWIEVRRTLEAENALQARTVATGKRISRELVQRMAELTDEEVALLVDATAVERGHLMWAAACRRYELIGEFAEEVVRERFLLLTPTLGADDFDSFVISKSLWNEELAQLADSSLRKLRTNLFLMLREAGILSDSGHIIHTVLSGPVSGVLAARIPSDIRFFPTYESVGRA